jgi:hypothetical protein
MGPLFLFDPVGSPRTAALAEMRTEMERYPQLQAVWRAIPLDSALSFEDVC